MKPKKIHVIPALVVAALVASTGMAKAQLTIDTTPFWDGFANVYPFGLPNTASYGQTITTPLLDPILSSFSFELNLPATTEFQGYVFVWNGAEASGTALYTSGVTSTAGTGFQQITFTTGDLSLAAGSSYVMFVSASEDPTSVGTGYVGWLPEDVYSGGEFVFLNNGTDTSQWTTTAWGSVQGTDLAFKASFVPIPEPYTSALIALAVMLLIFRSLTPREAVSKLWYDEQEKDWLVIPKFGLAVLGFQRFGPCG
jgi:hypothetical protein